MSWKAAAGLLFCALASLASTCVQGEACDPKELGSVGMVSWDLTLENRVGPGQSGTFVNDYSCAGRCPLTVEEFGLVPDSAGAGTVWVSLGYRCKSNPTDFRQSEYAGAVLDGNSPARVLSYRMKTECGADDYAGPYVRVKNETDIGITVVGPGPMEVPTATCYYKE